MTQYGWRDGKLVSKRLIVKDKMPVQYIIPKTVAYSTAGVLSGHDFNAASTALTNVSLALQPPYPMNLVLCANVAGTAGHADIIKIAGEDQFGDYVSENFYIKATAAATTAGSKAFGKVDSISVYAGNTDTSTTVKSSDIGIGWHKTIGLPWPIELNTDIISYTYDGSYATTAVDFLTVSKTNNTVVMPTMGAGVVTSIIYKTKFSKP